uniref:DUF5667 domain-containing protein n=1 Tax=Thermogemmatispora argillosa TaxID=2045280 RepID=A0A455SUK3_9CHLR|nr:hypothetical protein KTA_02560 [Thermogemmatispora argillosa]
MPETAGSLAPAGRLPELPAPAAPWPCWVVWLSQAIQQVGAYEVPLSAGQLRQLVDGLAALAARLETEATCALDQQRRTRAGMQAKAFLHRQYLRLSAASQQCDEARLLVGTLAQRVSREQLARLPHRHRPGVSGPDRLRQQVRQQLVSLRAALERLGSSSRPGGVVSHLAGSASLEGGEHR